MEIVQPLVNRPNETIGIVPSGKQRITHLVRRLYSVLLLFSQQQGEKEEYSALLSDLLAGANSEGSNRTQVKAILREIRAIGVDWNVRDGEREVWKNVGLIEEPGLIDGKGTPTIVTWKLPLVIRARLIDPRGFFTKISLQMMTRLRSGASIALYEICCQYASNDHGKGEGGLTARATIAHWMPRLTGSREADYEYKFFKRDVLSAAVREINEITDLEVELIEHKNGRKVVELQFRVFRKQYPNGVFCVAAEKDPNEPQTGILSTRPSQAHVVGSVSSLRKLASAGPTPLKIVKKANIRVASATALAAEPNNTALPLIKLDRATSASLDDAMATPPTPDVTKGVPAALDSITQASIPENELIRRMVALGVPQTISERLCAKYANQAPYLRRHVAFVEARVRSTASAPLQNKAAFLQNALEHGYADAMPAAAPGNLSVPPEVLLPVEDLDAQQQELMHRANTWARFQSMQNDATKTALIEAFLAQTGNTLKTFYRKNGVNNMIVKAALTDWLIREKGF